MMQVPNESVERLILFLVLLILIMKTISNNFIKLKLEEENYNVIKHNSEIYLNE